MPPSDYLLKVFAMARTAFFTASGFAALAFWIRFEIAWQAQHTEAEFKNRQFSFDIERASWLVETSLEYHLARNTEIPSSLVTCLSRNLFSSECDKKVDDTPEHEKLLKLILNNAKSLKFKVGDAEAEVNPKDLKKASD